MTARLILAMIAAPLMPRCAAAAAPPMALDKAPAPAVQKLRAKAMTGLADNDFAPLLQFLADPANAQLPALAADACSRGKLRQAVATTADDIQGMATLAKQFLPLAALSAMFRRARSLDGIAGTKVS